MAKKKSKRAVVKKSATKANRSVSKKPTDQTLGSPDNNLASDKQKNAAPKTVSGAPSGEPKTQAQGKKNIGKIGLVILVGIVLLVSLEVVISIKNKVKQDKAITQTGKFGIRGNQDRPEVFRGTLLGKIDKLDRYLLVDESFNKVLVWDAVRGRHLFSVDARQVASGDLLPRAVAGDSQGNVYILDASKQYIYVMSAAGKEVGGWEVKNANAIAVDSGDNLLVTDAEKKVIKRFSSSGELLDEFGNSGSRKKRVVRPWRLAVDASGDIYIIDRQKESVLVFNAKGKWKNTWSLKIADYQNTAIAVRAGKVYLNDFNSNIIWVYSTTGKLTWKIDQMYPGSIALDSAGDLYLAVGDGIGRFQLE